MYSPLNLFGYWTLNKHYYYYKGDRRLDLFCFTKWCSTTMSTVDFGLRLEGGRGVEIWVMELWGVFHSSLLNP